MRLLHMIQDGGIGGGPTAVALLVAGLRRLGHDVVIVMPPGPARALMPVPVFTAGVLDSLVGQVDLVHTHGKKAGILGRIAAHKAGKPAVHTHHGGLGFRGLRGKILLRIERWLARRFTAATVHVAHHQAARGQQIGLPGVAIPLGLDEKAMRAAALTKQEARFALGLPQNEKIIGAVGRLDRVKRWDLALYGVPEKTSIAFMGNGAEHDRLWRRARRIGVKAHWLPPRINAWRYLRAFDMLVLPSREEGCPLIVLESAALGVPILCSDIPAHRELLGSGSPYLVRMDWDWNAKMTQVLGPGRQPLRVGQDPAEYGRMIASHVDLYKSLARAA